MTLYDIIKEYLEKHGYNGLSDGNCYCMPENKMHKLLNCGEIKDCQPAYITRCDCLKDDCGYHILIGE